MELPLFPLNTVLFPGAMLPLHIFEERYKLMIASCIEERRPFGVLLIREGWEVGATAEPFEVGTTAHIARVDELEEGKMDLVCLGGKRFRTVRLVSEDPYLTGEVEFLSSTSTDDPKAKELSDDAGSLFAEYVRLYLAISNQWARSVEMPGEPDGLADFIGARLGVAPQVKQRLLEELSARTRLAIEVQILGEAIREMTPRVEEARIMRWHGFAVMN
ncbi:MAG: peptidase S16 [Chloroflexi bacterium]|nr:MAG: peptidase S16 [Chloroflexota bacterium]TMG07733.1 MAG: peptidase S16 [Chloroflexota bacterium]